MEKPSWWHACIVMLLIDMAINSRENIRGGVNNRENRKRFPP